jgi:TetR/AcrR family transcriptional repressor of nem operon
MIIIHNELGFSGAKTNCKFFGGDMGHSRAEKAETHERIVALAAKRFCEKGIEGIGIADLMKEAGLTVGGFYKHFDSRDDLVAEAIRSAARRWKRKAERADSRGTPITYDFILDDYLSEAHRDHPGAGCPLATLSQDIARSDKQTRKIVSDYVQENIEWIAKTIRASSKIDSGQERSLAILVYCALVGALAMARAVSDEKLSHEILTTVARVLKSSKIRRL